MEIGERPEEKIACGNSPPRPSPSPPRPPVKMLSVNQTSRKNTNKVEIAEALNHALLT